METVREESNDNNVGNTGSANKQQTAVGGKSETKDIGRDVENITEVTECYLIDETDKIKYIDEDSQSEEHGLALDTDRSTDAEIRLKQINICEDFSLKDRVVIFILLLFTIVFGILDVGTDVWLMCQYFRGGQYLYGTLTMVFVWGPSLCITNWLYLICCRDESAWLYRQLAKQKWIFIIFFLIPISSAVVAFNNFILFYKGKLNKRDYTNKKENLLTLQLYDSFLEAAPQLTLQLYVVLNNLEQATQDTSFLNILRWASMSFSMFTIARVMYTDQTWNINNIGVKEAVTQFICALLFVVSRMIVVSMGLAASPAVAGCCLLTHWTICAVDSYCQYIDKYTVTTNIRGSVIYATIRIFNYNWNFPSHNLCHYLSRRTYMYIMYTLQCVLFSVLWCMYSNIPGTVGYYAVPSVSVLLYVLYVPVAIVNRHYFKIRTNKDKKDIVGQNPNAD